MSERPIPRLSINLLNFEQDPTSWDHLIQRARAADEAGIDRLAVSDHVVFGEDLDAYAKPELGGREGGRQPTGPDGHWLEPIVLLSMLAGITQRARLMTSILIASLRRPVVLAKQMSTLDVLSGGRLDMGVGVGWQREEYEAAGLAFDGRGRLLDRTLEVCQALWTTNPTSFVSPELSFEGIHMMPKPAQPGGVPIWVSGTVNQRVAGRLGRFGSGWIPWGPAADDPATGIAQMREAVAEAGYETKSFDVLGTLHVITGAGGAPDLAATFASAADLYEAGVTDLRVTGRFPSDPAELVDYFGSLVEAFRSNLGAN